MALDPMPFGSGDFSFTMDTSLAYLCPPAPAPTPTPKPAPPPTPVAQDDTHCNEHMESLDERLAGASSELRKTREDVRLKQHKIASLLDLRRRNKHELDRIRHRNHLQSRQMEAITPSGGGVSGRSPAPSSSSPVAVHPLAMSNNPFALPRPAAVVAVAAQEGGSRAVAFQVPRFAPVVVGDDRSAAAAAPAQLQILAAKSSLASSSSPVAIHRPPMINNPFAVPSSAAVVAHEGTSTATAIQVPSEDMSAAAAAPQLQILAAKSPLASSSSPVAIQRLPMINPFAVPSPAAVVTHEGTSAATAIQVPSDDGSAAAPPQLQLQAAKSPLVSSSSPVAVDRPAMIKVSSSAASAAVVGASSSAAVAAQLAATRPYSVAHTPAVGEHRSAAAPTHLGLLAARRPLALHAPALVGQSSVARGAAVVAYGSAATVADLEILAAKRPLPQKGRLVQAVMEAGPLLENLMVAGPLPRWRNPPPALATAMTSATSTSGAQTGLAWSAH